MQLIILATNFKNPIKNEIRLLAATRRDLAEVIEAQEARERTTSAVGYHL